MSRRTRRSTHRRVSVRLNRGRLTAARFYVNGRAAARGFLGPGGVEWVAFYNLPELFDIDDTGRVISYGWA